MCYDPTARPPDPPQPARPATSEDLVLTAQDGNRLAAYLAAPSEKAPAQVLIFPDVRGLHGFYKALADRFAGQGISALAIDYFGRTAGLSARDDAFEYMPHVQQMQLPGFLADVEAGLAQLQSDDASTPTFTLGFCMGGALSLTVGMQNYNLAGVIAFYSALSRMHVQGAQPVLENATRIHYPVLGLFGGADQGIPPEQVQQLDNDLDTAGVEHEIVVYPGAPHSFFDRKAAEFADASADSWTRVLDFISAHSGQPAGTR